MAINKSEINKYLSGNKKGKDANKIEKEAIKDPFLNEALEGLEEFDSNPTLAMDAIMARISKKQEKEILPSKRKAPNNRNIFFWALPICAAVVILLFILAKPHDNIQVSPDVVISMEIIEPIDIFVPQDLDSKLQKNTQNKLGVSTFITTGHDILLITNKENVSIDILMPVN